MSLQFGLLGLELLLLTLPFLFLLPHPLGLGCCCRFGSLQIGKALLLLFLGLLLPGTGLSLFFLLLNSLSLGFSCGSCLGLLSLLFFKFFGGSASILFCLPSQSFGLGLLLPSHSLSFCLRFEPQSLLLGLLCFAPLLFCDPLSLCLSLLLCFDSFLFSDSLSFLFFLSGLFRGLGLQALSLGLSLSFFTQSLLLSEPLPFSLCLLLLTDPFLF